MKISRIIPLDCITLPKYLEYGIGTVSILRAYQELKQKNTYIEYANSYIE